MADRRLALAGVGVVGALTAHALDEARLLPGVHENDAVVHEVSRGPLVWLVLGCWLIGLALWHGLRRRRAARSAPPPVQVARFAVRCTVHCAVLLLAVEIGARAASGLEPLDPEELTALGTAVGVQVLIAVLAAALLWLVAMGLARLAPAGDSVCGPELPSCLVVHAGAVPARRRRHTSYLGRAPPGAGILLSDQR